MQLPMYIIYYAFITYKYNYFISMKPVRFDKPYYNILKSRVHTIRVDNNNIKILRSVSLTQQVYTFYAVLQCRNSEDNSKVGQWFLYK